MAHRLERARLEHGATEVLTQHEGLAHLDVEVRGDAVIVFSMEGRREAAPRTVHVARRGPLWALVNPPHGALGADTVHRPAA